MAQIFVPRFSKVFRRVATRPHEVMISDIMHELRKLQRLAGCVGQRMLDGGVQMDATRKRSTKSASEAIPFLA